MLARFPAERPTAAAVQAEASRLAEVYSEGDAAIEEVEVELVDISRGAPPMPRLGWMPPPGIANLQASALGTARRR